MLTFGGYHSTEPETFQGRGVLFAVEGGGRQLKSGAENLGRGYTVNLVYLVDMIIDNGPSVADQQCQHATRNPSRMLRGATLQTN